jgi:hypothetical protein
MSKKQRIFSCPECGEPYEAYPPSDDYDMVSLEHPKEGQYRKDVGVKKVTHDCGNDKCHHPIELYWYRRKLGIAVG